MGPNVIRFLFYLFLFFGLFGSLVYDIGPQVLGAPIGSQILLGQPRLLCPEH